ncbi:MAG: DegQ family serine endoprotease [Geobacter sp.]|nr:DegQ family serine endoprotease [Geobacter sp.]
MRRIWLPFFLIYILAAVTACKKKEEAVFYESSRKGMAEAPVKEVPKDALATQQAFTALAKTVTPSVVNISTISKKKMVRPFFEFSPFSEDFFGSPQYRRDQSLGSGFIINRQGYIITNEHVVRDAETIKVKLSNEDVYEGKVVGTDAKTDIAVIKINAKEDLPFAVMGDSDKLEVGQWAIAIGNPFGLDRTFTVGVVSATGRSNMGIETYEDFIQTDASINPGNSGGPLLNVHGEVIGINTAVVAAGQGIGFAIPINMAKKVVSQLVGKGQVNRGWLGVSIQQVTPDIAQSFGQKKPRGALVSEVIAGGGAAQAGIRQGDIILRFDGAEVRDVRHLQRLVADVTAGKKIEVVVFRDGKELPLTVTVGSAESAAARKPRPAEQGGAPADTSWVGLSVDELPADLRKRGVSGVMVRDVEEGSIAGDGGIQRGDIIVSVNQRKVSNLDEFARQMKEAGQRGSVAFLVRRGGASIYFAFRIK